MFGSFVPEKKQDDGKSKESEELFKRRESHAVEIRTKNRIETFNKTRKLDSKIEETNQNVGTNSSVTTSSQKLNVGNEHNNINNSSNSVIHEELKEKIDIWLKQQYNFSQFFDLLQMIQSNEVFEVHHGCIGLRQILSVQENPPIQAAIDANLIPKFIQLIKNETQPHLQLQAAWALTNIASGTTIQTQAIIEKGGIPLFCKLLSSPHRDIAEQAIWALGNIAGDCANYRDMILKHRGLDPLIKLVEEATSRNTVKHGTWALSNLCRGRPLPDFQQVKNCIPIMCKVIQHETDSEVLTDACWALSYLSDGDDDRIDLVVSTNVVPALIRLTDHPYMSVLVPTLRTLGNIVSGNETQTNMVLSHGIIDKLKPLLKHEKRAVRREVCWILSNITAGTSQQISFIINDLELMEKLFMLIDSDSSEIQREATWVISNSTNQGKLEDIKQLIQYGILTVFLQLLQGEDLQTISIILEALYNILNHGQHQHNDKGENIFYAQLEVLGASSVLEKLQKHPNQDVYKQTVRILQEFYPLDDDIF